jgi:hypothetical protein
LFLVLSFPFCHTQGFPGLFHSFVRVVVGITHKRLGAFMPGYFGGVPGAYNFGKPGGGSMPSRMENQMPGLLAAGVGRAVFR